MSEAEGPRTRSWRKRLPDPSVRRLLLALALASLAMVGGFWLKWRYLLVPDPHAWYLYSWGQMAYTDLVALYLQQGLDSHPIPYLQTRLEYPVVVGVAQYLFSFAPGPQAYFMASSLALALAGLGVVWILHQMDRSARLWVFAATPPLLLYAALNWDLLALFFALLSVCLFQQRRDGWSALALSLGIWTKLFPGALLFWMLLKRAAERDWGGVALITGIVVAVSAVLNLPVYLASPSGWLYFFDYQGARPPDDGSLWFYLPGWPVQAVNLASLIAGGVGVAALGVAEVRAGRGVEEFGLGSLALLILVSKITSPQYDLWLVPFLALVPAPIWMVGVFVGADLAYFWVSYQTLYLRWGGQSDFAALQPMVAGTVNAAHQAVLLMLLLWIVARALTPRKRPQDCSEPPNQPAA